MSGWDWVGLVVFGVPALVMLWVLIEGVLGIGDDE